MAAGQFVFPVIVVGFVLFWSGFVLVTPATPPDELPPPAQRNLRVQPGDDVIMEFTIFYGPYGQGFVWFSTQEERVGSLPLGPIPREGQSQPWTYHVAPTLEDARFGLDKELLGHRVGDSFRTGSIPANESGLGDWIDEREFDRHIPGFPRNVTLDATTQITRGRYFNLTDYIEFWRGRGTEVAVGAQWKCEDERLWDCAVRELNTTEGRLTYERLVSPGDEYEAGALFGNIETRGDLTWAITATGGERETEFGLRLDPPVDVRFQLTQAAGGPFEPGTYLVTGLDDENVYLRYSDASQTHPGLVGEPIYYDVQILRIVRG